MSKIIRTKLIDSKPYWIEVPSLPENEEENEEEKDKYVGALTKEERALVKKMLASMAETTERVDEILLDAKEKADALLLQSQEKGAKLIKEAEDQVQEIKNKAKEEAYQEGYAYGRQKGEQEIRQEMSHLLEDAQNNADKLIEKANIKAECTLKDAEMAMIDYEKKAEKDIVDMVMSVVKKVLPQHFIDVPKVIVPLVKDVISRVSDQKNIIVNVPPQSYDLVLKSRDDLRQLLIGGDSMLEIHSDSSLRNGDCLIQMPNGIVDARLDVQMALIEQAVRDMIS